MTDQPNWMLAWDPDNEDEDEDDGACIASNNAEAVAEAYAGLRYYDEPFARIRVAVRVSPDLVEYFDVGVDHDPTFNASPIASPE